MKSIFKSFFLLFVALLAISPIIVYCITLRRFGFAESSGDFGVFGDYIGGTIGTIVGAISIYLVYITYSSQVKFARKQDEAMKHQQFETTFFSLLEQQQMIRSQLKGIIGDDTYEGILYLQGLKSQLEDALSELNYIQDEVTEDNKVMLKNRVNGLYVDFFLPNVSNLGHYFRHLYHILKYIDDSQLSDSKKYADLLQSQLSNDELYMIAINGISNYGRKKMLPLMDKYGFLENYNANALRRAKGRWIAFLDSDDLWLPAKLEHQLKFMTDNGYYFSYTGYEEIDENSQKTGVRISGPKHVAKLGMFSFCWPGCLTVMYNSDHIGLLQIADIKKNNDYAMWLKVIQKTDCFLLDECLARYRRGRKGSVSTHGYSTMIRWHYKLWHEAMGMNALVSLFWTGVNLVCGVYKKMHYVKNYSAAILGKH